MINTNPFHKGLARRRNKMISCVLCFLHVVTHSAQSLHTGCPRMRKNCNYPWLGRLRTHQCQILPLCYIDSTTQDKQQQPIIRPRGGPTTLNSLQTTSMAHYTRNPLKHTKRLSPDYHFALSVSYSISYVNIQKCNHLSWSSPKLFKQPVIEVIVSDSNKMEDFM